MKAQSLVRTIIFAGSFLLQLGTLCFHLPGAPGDVDLSFDPGSSVTNPVSGVVVQPDGKVLIGGLLTFINGTNRYASARLNPDGSRDHTFVSDSFTPSWTALFQNGFFNYAEATVVAVQPDGKVLMGGIAARICALGEEDCQNHYSSFVTRLNPDGSHDPDFSPFYGDGGLAVEQIPQLKTVAVQPGGKVVVGFVGYGYVRGIFRLNANGIWDTNFNVSIGSGLGVESVVAQTDGKLLMSGSFTSVNGTNRNGLARLNPDGSLDNSFTPATAGSPLALQPDGKVLVGGYARLNTDGSLDSSFNQVTGVNGGVRSIALQPDGKILLGGSFTAVNGVARPHVARLYGDSAPSLNIAQSNALVIVSWPVSGLSFQLQESSDLVLPDSWSPAVEAAFTNAGQISVTVPTTVGRKFFRLKSQ